MVSRLPRGRLLAKLLAAMLVPAALALALFGAAAHEVARRVLEEEMGRRSFVGPTSWARTSMVPLEGSMTGLISITLAENFASRRSMEVTSRVCPRWILPAKRSGRVDRKSTRLNSSHL